MWFAKAEGMKAQTFRLKFTAVFLLLTGMLTFSGCHTVKGAGKDIENAGEGIQNAADKHS